MPIPAYGTAETLALLQQRFGYIFEQPKGGSGSLYRPLLQARVINGSFTISEACRSDRSSRTTASVRRRPVTAWVAWRTRPTWSAWMTPPSLYSADLDLWIVDCLRYEPHPTHAHFDLTLSWIARAKPKRADPHAPQSHGRLATTWRHGARRASSRGYDGLTAEIDD